MLLIEVLNLSWQDLDPSLQFIRLRCLFGVLVDLHWTKRNMFNVDWLTSSVTF